MIKFDPQIQKDFDKVVKYSQDYLFEESNIINTTPIFDLWATNKEKIYALMGNKLIYETEEVVEFKLTIDRQRKELHDFYDRIACNFGLSDLVRFIANQSLEAVYNNRTSTGYEYGDVKIPKDMKLSKAFKFFIENENTLRRVQDMFSELIQKNKISGKLCISIHPLDFLSTSETNYNWRSCHALDGEYRAGGLSYMCDATTVVCYIKGAESVKLPRFPHDVLWNDKRWRMLLHMEEGTQQLMVAGRQYPFEVDGARERLKDIIDAMKSIAYRYRAPYNDHHFVEWNNDHFTSFSSVELSNPEEVKRTVKPYRYINGLISAMSTFVKTPKKHPLHYNDIMLSHVYPWPHITWESNRSFSIVPKVRVGYDGVPCVCCGEQPICNSETFACRECNCSDDSDDYYNCDYCGRRVYQDDIYYVDYDDSYLCHNCYHEHFTVCVHCGYSMPHDEVVYNEELDAYVCNECIRESTAEVSQVKLTPNEISFTVDNAQINTEFLERVLGVNIEEQYRAVEDEIRNRIQDDINQHMERNMLPF